ncbi:MAG: M64 family metallopeptidase [Mesorhizobium sp.]
MGAPSCSDRSWGTGASWALWSAVPDDAPGVALHEAGHSFQQLADEYTDVGEDCGEYPEVNTTADALHTNGKWEHWLGFDAVDATGVQCIFQGSAMCRFGEPQYRSSQNSMMNSLYGENKNTSFNAVSREKIIMDIWRVVRPIDAAEPEAGDVPAPITLKVYVVDPSVISVDWSLDGELIATDAGPAYDVAAAGLATGTHVITARAYDNADDSWVRARSGRCIDEAHCWNRDAWKNSEQSVSWSVNVP